MAAWEHEGRPEGWLAYFTNNVEAFRFLASSAHRYAFCPSWVHVNIDPPANDDLLLDRSASGALGEVSVDIWGIICKPRMRIRAESYEKPPEELQLHERSPPITSSKSGINIQYVVVLLVF